MDVLDGDDHSWHDMVSWVESGTGTRRSCIDRTTAATLEWQYFGNCALPDDARSAGSFTTRADLYWTPVPVPSCTEPSNSAVETEDLQQNCLDSFLLSQEAARGQEPPRISSFEDRSYRGYARSGTPRDRRHLRDACCDRSDSRRRFLLAR